MLSAERLNDCRTPVWTSLKQTRFVYHCLLCPQPSNRLSPLPPDSRCYLYFLSLTGSSLVHLQCYLSHFYKSKVNSKAEEGNPQKNCNQRNRKCPEGKLGVNDCCGYPLASQTNCHLFVCLIVLLLLL